jgi:LysR family transcriptional regulator, benzoate and cis,cis-muconate-responsive activator of ben and cat genes
MDIRQLRYFLALSEELSFTKAAARLHVSQPPVSYQIASLESELGTALFIRTSRSVKLTDAGRALIPHARAVSHRLDDAKRQISRIGQGIEGKVSIGLSGSHFLGPLPRFIKSFRQEQPGIEVALMEMRPVDHIAALREGRLDVSIARTLINDDLLQSTLLWSDPVVAALPEGHCLVERKTLRLTDLRQEDFIFLRLDSSSFAQSAHQACLAEGFTPRIVQEVVEVSAALNLVAAGLGVAVVPQSLSTQSKLQDVYLRKLRGLHFNGDVNALTQLNSENLALKTFVKSLTQWAQKTFS